MAGNLGCSIASWTVYWGRIISQSDESLISNGDDGGEQCFVTEDQTSTPVNSLAKMKRKRRETRLDGFGKRYV